jgi:hypothetical protein
MERRETASSFSQTCSPVLRISHERYCHVDETDTGAATLRPTNIAKEGLVKRQ